MYARVAGFHAAHSATNLQQETVESFVKYFSASISDRATIASLITAISQLITDIVDANTKLHIALEENN